MCVKVLVVLVVVLCLVGLALGIWRAVAASRARRADIVQVSGHPDAAGPGGEVGWVSRQPPLAVDTVADRPSESSERVLSAHTRGSPFSSRDRYPYAGQEPEVVEGASREAIEVISDEVSDTENERPLIQ